MEFNPYHNQYTLVVSRYLDQGTVAGQGTGVRKEDQPGSGRLQEAPAGRSPAVIADKVSLSLDAEQLKEMEKVQKMAARDREVVSHEAAHAAVGGPYAGPPSYTYSQGPDGKRYRVGGQVQMDVSVVPGDPGATLQKANTIRAAALAPPDPSAADRSIAARAARMAAQARAEMLHEGTDALPVSTEKIEDPETGQQASPVERADQPAEGQMGAGTRAGSGQLLDIMG